MKKVENAALNGYFEGVQAKMDELWEYVENEISASTRPNIAPEMIDALAQIYVRLCADIHKQRPEFGLKPEIVVRQIKQLTKVIYPKPLKLR